MPCWVETSPSLRTMTVLVETLPLNPILRNKVFGLEGMHVERWSEFR